MASDIDDDSTDESLRRTKIIKSAFDSESFDSDLTFQLDGLVGAATISPSGRDVALASPEGLAIIDLDSPYSAPRRVKSHGMPWLVVDVQWSPFSARDNWVASTANHCCLVWDLNRPDDSSAGAVEHSLRGHRRSITDINFSAHHPDILATCSVDGYVHCWDLRRPSMPALTFIDWVAGATQVKYNRQDEHVIASSHNRSVHIWDDRKTSQPLRTIEAHTSKIYGLDWNRTVSTALVTCSLDKTIKFWDYAVRGGGSGSRRTSGSTDSTGPTVAPMNERDVPDRVIKTDFPVWRARHTPFGSGVLAMPQNAPGNLYLYDARPVAELPADRAAAPNEPASIFRGHGHHKVKEFLWRTRGGIQDGLDNREFQLVSWGEDNKLRLQRLDSSDLGTVGYQRGQPAPANLNITRRGAAYKTFRILEDIGEYEKRSATMSSTRPMGYRGPASLPAGQGQSRLESPTVDSHAHHHHQHHHHALHHSQHHRHQQEPSQPQGREQQPQLQSHKSVTLDLPPPRSLSSSSIAHAAPKSSPQRVKYNQRSAWRNPAMRASHATHAAHVTGRKNPEQSNEQLDWMKGVTMNKRKPSAEPALTSSQEQLAELHHADAHRKVSSDSALSSPLQMSAHDASVSMSSDVNEPESTQEEIKRLINKLPRINWEEIDMDNLTLVASMKGPWGVSNQIVFINVRVSVPQNYPVTRAPRFYVDKSTLVPLSTQDRIASDLLLLTTEYLKRQRKCLLVAFRYLLGEIDLQGGLALLNRALTNPRLVDIGSSSSSSSSDDDDDDGGGGLHVAHNEFLSSPAVYSTGADAMFGPILPLVPAPPPRSCGAVFTRDGRLVAFFLTKSGKASAKLLFDDPPPLTAKEMAELEQPVFIGFGKVLPPRTGISGRHRKQGPADASEANLDPALSEKTDAPSDSDGVGSCSSLSSLSSSSSSSSSTSSSSSSTSDLRRYSATNFTDPWRMNMGFQRRIVKHKADHRRRSSDFDSDLGDSLIHSGTLDTSLPPGPMSTVAIEDMRPYLPSKRDLARDYAIFGDGADVCEHNARVADKIGDPDLANVWRYAALLLKSNVPLRLASVYDIAGRRQKSILIIAREAVIQARERESQKTAKSSRTPKTPKSQTPKSQTTKTSNSSSLTGRVKWGLHPLAREFVHDLFDHFERLADVQMLAMLSCIFGESFEEDSVAYAESHMSKSDTPLPMKAPSFSLEYVPTTRGYLDAAPLPPRLGHPGSSTPRPHPFSSHGRAAAATPDAIFYDGSIDPDDGYDDEDEDCDLAYDDELRVWDMAVETGTSPGNSLSGSETPPNWFGASAVNGYGAGSSSARGGILSSSPSFGHAAGQLLRRGNSALVTAIAAGIPQTLTSILSSSPNDRNGGGGGIGSNDRGSSGISISINGLRPAPMPSAVSRRPSFFSSAPPSQRQSPQTRTSYLSAAGPPPQPRFPARPGPSRKDPAIAVRPKPGNRDIPYWSSVSQRLLGSSTSTSPKSTGGGLGKRVSLSSSPQDHAAPVRKRPSPAETIFSNLTAGNLTWAASALFGGSGSGGNASAGPSTQPGTAATSYSDESRRREQAMARAAANAAAKGIRAQAEAEAANMVAVNVVVRTYNDHLFDDDGWMAASLLGEQKRRRLYAEYRYAYSELLHVWSEPLARLEVLKFNVLREDAMKAAAVREGVHGTASAPAPSVIVNGPKNTSSATIDETKNGKEPGRGSRSSSTTSGTTSGTGSTTKGTAKATTKSTTSLTASLTEKQQQLLEVRESGRGLDAVGICQYCELQLEPIEYDVRPATPAAEPVRSRQGGAIGTCRRCRQARTQLRCVYCTDPVDAIYVPCFGCGCASHLRCLQAWYDAGERLCPAGDECPCAEEALAGRIESWEALKAGLSMGGGGGGADTGGTRSTSVGATGNNASHHPARSIALSESSVTAPYPGSKSKGLIAQARRSTHYAASSSSAVLVVSPYGQHYHAADSNDANGPASTTTSASSHRSAQQSVSRASLPRYYRGSSNSAHDAFTPDDDALRSPSGSSYTGSGSPGASTSAINNGRRPKAAASGLRQQLQQQQLELRQHAQQRQGQQPPPHDSHQLRRAATADGSLGLESTLGHEPGSPSMGSPAHPTASSHLSAARLSLSSRLLRSSMLRRQSNTGGNGGSSKSESYAGGSGG